LSRGKRGKKATGTSKEEKFREQSDEKENREKRNKVVAGKKKEGGAHKFLGKMATGRKRARGKERDPFKKEAGEKIDLTEVRGRQKKKNRISHKTER